MTIKTTTIERLPNQMGMLGGKDFQAVTVNGVRVGTIGKNKYGIWIGNFDREAFGADNPFVAARRSHTVRPSVRGLRTKRDVVNDIAVGQVGAYEAEIQAQIAARGGVA